MSGLSLWRSCGTEFPSNRGWHELGLMSDPMPAGDKTSNVLAYWGTGNRADLPRMRINRQMEPELVTRSEKVTL